MPPPRRLYLDSSAFAKLFVPEPESEAVRALTAEVTIASSDLLAIEATRVARRFGGDAPREAATAIAGADLEPIDQEVRDRAAEIGPIKLRALDAIHLATAERVRASIDALVTYDRRLAKAAEALGIPVLSPA